MPQEKQTGGFVCRWGVGEGRVVFRKASHSWGRLDFEETGHIGKGVRWGTWTEEELIPLGGLGGPCPLGSAQPPTLLLHRKPGV